MPRIEWDKTGERLWETGLDRGVLFKKTKEGAYGAGVPWNGLINVTEGVSGGEATPFYADNIKYANVTSKEEFNPSIEAYYYPDEFKECDGSKEIAPGVYIGQQNRTEFGLAYRTLIGNDIDDQDHGYKIHIVYSAKAAPSEKTRSTVNESVELGTMSWECTTTPVPVTGVEGLKATAHLVIDSTKTTPENLRKLEDLIYGTDEAEPTLPTPDEVIALVGVAG